VKAIRLIEIGKPLQAQEVTMPTLGPDDIRVRVKAAGICHSDVHYRAGTSYAGALPLTLGHEVAGVVEAVGTQVTGTKVGDRVSLHYLVTCGACHYCSIGSEQFCVQGKMLGKHTAGGFAETITVPARNAVPLPDEIPFEHGAVLMCSSATSFHALRKGRLKAGETVAVFGVGGLGMSAIQIARALGALDVYAVDINADKLRQAEGLGAIPVNAAGGDPVAEIRRFTKDNGVDVSLEVIGLPETMKQAVQVLGPFGHAVLVGIGGESFQVNAYTELIGKEAEIIGCNDHLRSELPLLLEYARRGALDLSGVVTCRVPLDADAVNETLDALEQFRGEVRTVITP